MAGENPNIMRHTSLEALRRQRGVPSWRNSSAYVSNIEDTIFVPSYLVFSGGLKKKEHFGQVPHGWVIVWSRIRCSLWSKMMNRKVTSEAINGRLGFMKQDFSRGQ